jgi:hypothetical protein
LYSGGSLATRLYDSLAAICEHGPEDINGDAKLLRSCVIRELQSRHAGGTGLLAELLDGMPGLQEYLRSITPEQRAAYVGKIVETAYSPVNSEEKWLESTELSTMAVVLHYGEAVLTRYDLNGDGMLDAGEVEAAESIFVGYIEQFISQEYGIPSSLNFLAPSAFYYILENQKMPSYGYLIGLVGKPLFVPGYLVTHYLWSPSFQLDRGKLASVFQVIISKLMAHPAAERPPMCGE